MSKNTTPRFLHFQENICQISWCVCVEGHSRLLRRRAKFWLLDNFFEHFAEGLAHPDGSFGGRLNEQTFVLSGDGFAFGSGDLSQVVL